MTKDQLTNALERERANHPHRAIDYQSWRSSDYVARHLDTTDDCSCGCNYNPRDYDEDRSGWLDD